MGAQFTASLMARLRIKRRTRGAFFMDLFLPVYMLVAFILITFALSNKSYPVNLDYPSQAIPTTALGLNQHGASAPTGAVIAFAPAPSQCCSATGCNATTFAQNLVTEARNHFTSTGGPPWTCFLSEAEMVQFTGKGDTPVLASIYIQDENFNISGISASNPLQYTVSVNQSGMSGLGPDSLFAGPQQVGPDDDASKWISSTWLSFSQLVQQSAMRMALGTPVQLNASAGFAPTAAYTVNTKATTMSYYTPIYLPMVFAFALRNFVAQIVTDKKQKIRTGLKMMGMRDSMYWAVWVVMMLGALTFFSVLGGVIFKFGKVLEHSDVLIVIICFELFAISMIMFTIAYCSFFSEPQTAQQFVMIALIIFGTPCYAFTARNGSVISTTIKNLANLLSPTAFSFAINIITELEVGAEGVQWHNIADAGATGYAYSVADAMCMMALDTVLYGLLAWYLPQVVPSEFGTTKPWNFCLQHSYWRGTAESSWDAGTEMNPALGSADKEDGEWVQAVDESAVGEMAVQIRSLRKEFPPTDHGGPVKVAVDDMNLSMYEGQVFALLGHNGAGKSTTCHMLTGLYPPTSGDARLYGRSIVREMDEVQSMLGVCPQHDILFDLLTVREHLRLYGLIKGVDPAELPLQIETKIADVSLQDKANTPAKELSGGMKRKLSTAIALLGSPKIVFLDEPTSGMDPAARRLVWSLLAREKHGRVIVLTTHFMDEADLLGDRIAIMSKGKIRVLGSSLYLKARFGIGYSLTATLSKQAAAGPQGAAAVLALVQRFVPEASTLSSAATELRLRLPLDAAVHFGPMLGALDKQMGALGVHEYGMSVTSLEEVFLRIAEEDHNDDKDDKDDNNKGAAAGGADTSLQAGQESSRVRVGSKLHEFGAPSLQREGSMKESLLGEKLDAADLEAGTSSGGGGTTLGALALEPSEWRQVCALLQKRILHTKVFYPVLMVVLAVLVSKAGADPSDSTAALPLNTSCFAGRRRDGFDSMLRIQYCGCTRTHSADGRVAASGSVLVANDNSTAAYEAAMVGTYPGGVDVAVSAAPTAPLSSSSSSSSSTTTAQNLSQQLFAGVRGGGAAGGVQFYDQMPAGGGDTGNDAYSLVYNSSFLTSAPVLASLVNSALLRRGLDAVGTTTGAGMLFQPSYLPLPTTPGQKDSASIAAQSGKGILLAIFFVIAFGYIPGSISNFVVMEKSKKIRHQQSVMGVSFSAYHVSNLLVDIVLVVPVLLVTLIIAHAGSDSLGSGPSLGAVALCVFIWIFAASGWSYCWARLFDTEAAALGGAIMVNVFGGMIFTVAYMVLILIYRSSQNPNPTFYTICVCIQWIGGILLPSVNLGIAFQNLAFYQLPVMAAGLGLPGVPSVLSYKNGVGESALVLAVAAVWWWSVLMLCEHRAARKKATGYDGGLSVTDDGLEDADVKMERERVTSGQADGENIVIKNMRKVYPPRRGVVGSKPKQAVKDFCLGIPTGQCFGLLGVNGAGKTTTLSMLSGDFAPSSGSARLAGYDVASELPEVLGQVGYCPQFDALMDHLTGREMLRVFAGIKGVPETEVEALADSLISRLGLTMHADNATKGYSGGNKRKLSLALALIGAPKLVFLDEPSSGMDPFARREMWKVISSALDGCSVILTTHFMEEADALCQRIGIMVNGRMCCLGSSQHLKSIYGSGYQIEISTSTNDGPSIERLRTFLQGLAPAGAGATAAGDGDGEGEGRVKFLEWHGGHIKCELPSQRVSLARVFQQVEQERNALAIVDYAVSQTSLEKVFLSFAKLQHEEGVAVSAVSVDDADANVTQRADRVKSVNEV